jgi:type I restriction enzyme S subunit
VTAEVKLPEDWILTKIGDVCLLNPKEKLEDELEIGFMPMTGVSTDYFSACKFESRKWLDAKKGFTQFRNGDAIFAKITPCFENSKAAIIQGFPNGWGAGSTEYYVLRPIANAVNPKLLFALVKTQDFLINGALNMSGSVGHKRVPKDFVVNYSLPFPPLAEQKVIADKLDTLLAQVESTKARLERIPQILKRFRQSVLAAAVSGKLTEEWRGSNSFKIFELKLSKGQMTLEIPNSWSEKKLDESCEVISGNAFKSNDFLDVGEIPAIKISNIQYGEFEVKNQQYLPLKFLNKYKRFQVRSGELLMALTRPVTNETLKVCRYPDDQPIGLLNQRVCKFSFSNLAEKTFFEILFQSEYFKAQVIDNLSETLQPNLSPKSLMSFVVAIPSLEEQTEIVRRVEQLFAYADTIEQQVQNALTRVNNLTQSILAKAFRGELTEQWRKDNPDLISGDNSAEALLEKIKAEREAIKPEKKNQARKMTA